MASQNANNVTLTGGTISNVTVNSSSINGLINGGFEIWPNGTSIAVAASTTAQYTADRWCLSTLANQACVVSQQVGLVDGSQFCGRIQRNSGQTGTGPPVLEQPFELAEIVKYRGKKITVSFQASTGANWSPTSGRLNIYIICGTGAARARAYTAYTSETFPLNTFTNITAGSAAAAYSFTSAAVIPTNTAQMTLFFTWDPIGTAGANDWFQLDDVMWSVGTAAQPFEREDCISYVNSSVQDFRLSLTSDVPLTTSDVTGATTIYCTPYIGNCIALYVLGGWVKRISKQFSLALGTLTSGKVYDVFCYDNSGVPTLEFLVWTNDTTRATALAYQDGVLVKSGDATRRYMGSFYTTATTTTEDSKGNRYLWNYYNRAKKYMLRLESAGSWNYTTATWRKANNNTANQLNFLVGVSEDAIQAHLSVICFNSTSGVYSGVGLALDWTSGEPSAPPLSFITSTGATFYLHHTANYESLVSDGRHYIAWVEYCTASGTQSWDGGTHSGINGSIFC